MGDHRELLLSTAAHLCANGKGILASDESTGTIGKRLAAHGLENTEENRRQYRQLLYSAGLGGQGVSGAIMFSETLGQSADSGQTFVDMLNADGILPGIKVDEGLTPAGDDGETLTTGLGNLDDNCAAYFKQGARFAKWRATLRVDEAKGLPTPDNVQANAAQLAKYAAICQANGLVPIVEPEILMEGSHGMDAFAAASERVLQACTAALWSEGVLLEACILKPQMIVPGADCPDDAPSPEAVAEATLTVLRRSVPAAMPGIMFLSGGQSEESATRNLDAIGRAAAGSGNCPWALSFSFGRALQASALALWAKDRSGNYADAQELARRVCGVNAAAARGEYEGPHPSTTGQLQESFRGWSGQPTPAAVG